MPKLEKRHFILRPKVNSSNALCLTSVECTSIEIVKVRAHRILGNVGKSSEI